MKGLSLRWTLLFAAASSAAIILLLWITPDKLGVSPDSTVYLATAKSILEGDGFTDRGQPMTQYPPGYPLLLAAAGALGGDVLGAARWLHAILFAANVILTGYAVKTGTRGSFTATAASMLFLLASSSMISVHTMLWSEPAFITATLAGLILLATALETNNRSRMLWAAAAFGAALSIRFAGIVLGGLLIVSIVLFWRTRGASLWRLLAATTAVFATPLVMWLGRSPAQSSVPGYWSLSFHPPGFGHARLLINTVHDFLFAVFVSDWSRLFHLSGVVVLLLTGLVVLHRRGLMTRDKGMSGSAVLVALCGLVFLLYTLFILLTIALVSAETPLDQRIMLPVLLPLLIGLISLGHLSSIALGTPSIRTTVTLLVLLAVSVNANRAHAEASDFRKHGRWFTSHSWESSQVLSALGAAAPSSPIYTNAPDAVWLNTSRVALPLPRKANADTRMKNTRYGDEMIAMCRELQAGRAILAYFNTITWAWFYPVRNEIERECRLRPSRAYADGQVYGLAVQDTQ